MRKEALADSNDRQEQENHSPWQRRLNLIYGLGVAAIVAMSMFLQAKGMLEVPYLVGTMLFVFDLFGPLKALKPFPEGRNSGSALHAVF